MSPLTLKLALRGTGGRLETPALPTRLGRATVVIPCYRYGHYLPARLPLPLISRGSTFT